MNPFEELFKHLHPEMDEKTIDMPDHMIDHHRQFCRDIDRLKGELSDIQDGFWDMVARYAGYENNEAATSHGVRFHIENYKLTIKTPKGGDDADS